MNIRSFRKPITVLATIVCIFDLLVAFKLWAYRPWNNIVVIDNGVLDKIKVVPIWNRFDLLILIISVVFQIALAYAAYKAWTSKPKNQS
jgi:hypothetical protein